LVSVAVCGALLEPMFWEPKFRLDADKLTPAATGGGAAPPPPHVAHTPTTNSTAASAHAL
jgi:hypothetical protein